MRGVHLFVHCFRIYLLAFLVTHFWFGIAESGHRNRTFKQNNTLEQRNFIRPSKSSSTNSTVQLFVDDGLSIGGKKEELDLSHFYIESIVFLSIIEVQIFSDSSVLVFVRKFATEESWYGEATCDTGFGSMKLLISDGEITG